MNNTLALYFDDECIMAAIQPFEGKLSVIKKHGMKRFFLYFLIDGSAVHYGENYRLDYLENKPDTYGDIYDHIQHPDRTFSQHGYKQPYTALLDKVLEDIKALYFHRLNELLAVPVSTTNPIPIAVAFSDNIPVNARKVLIGHLVQSGYIYQSQGSLPALPELIVRKLIKTKQIPRFTNQYGVAEALNRNLNISLVDIGATGILKRSRFDSYPGFGTDPRIEVIAKYVVDEINSSWNFLNTHEEKEKEYQRQFEEAKKWNNKLTRSIRPYVDVTASLSVAPNSPTVITINKGTIDELTRLHSLEISRLFERTVKEEIEDLANIITIGSTLHNSQVMHGFDRFGKDRRIQLPDDFVFEAMGELLIEQNGQHEKPQVKQKAEIQAVEIVKVENLLAGQKIAFSWKKNRLVVAEYLGNYKFRIIQHEESKVITDDTFVLDQIAIGKPVILREVYRPSLGKKLGVYNSGAAITSLRKMG